MDCRLPSSTVHGILQARILEWVPIPFSRGFSQPRDQTQVSRITGKFFTVWATREAPKSRPNLKQYSVYIETELFEIKDKKFWNYEHDITWLIQQQNFLLCSFHNPRSKLRERKTGRVDEEGGAAGGEPSLLILSTLGTQIVFKVRLHLSRGVCKFDHSQHPERAPTSFQFRLQEKGCLLSWSLILKHNWTEEVSAKGMGNDPEKEKVLRDRIKGKRKSPSLRQMMVTWNHEIEMVWIQGACKSPQITNFWN